MAGAVWTERKQILLENIEESSHFLRSIAAKKIGLKAVLGIPLIFNDEVVGVLKIGTKHDAAYLNQYAYIFKQLEGFIGSELNRKKLENDLSHLFTAIPDILCLLDFRGKFLKINKAGCDLMGYSEEEILNQDFADFVHKQDKGIFANEVMGLAKKETIFSFENRYITKSGDIVWLSWYCKAALKEGIIYATAKNITQEKKLRELNRQSSSLAKIGSWEIDLVNQTVFWSDMVHELHETDSKSFVPNLETGIHFYREDFQYLVKSTIEKCIDTGEPFDFEAVLVTTKKKERWVRAIGNAEFTDGDCKRIYGSFQDINILKESENRLLSLSANLPGIIYQYIIHPDGTDSIQHILGAIEQVWGFTANEVEGNLNLVWDQIKAGGDFELVKKSILKSIENKSRWNCRLKYVLPSGEIRTQLGVGTPTFLADGTIVYNSITLDITEEAKNEELLQQVSEMSRIGSWEMHVLNQGEDSMFWSAMLKKIVEVDDNYSPTLSGGLEFYIGESRERIKQAITLLINDSIGFDQEFLILTAKGNERWVRVIGKSEVVNNNRTRIYGSFQDIHVNKLLENRVVEILESISDAFYAVDKDWKFTYFNKEAERLLQQNEKDVLGKNLWEVFPAVVGTSLDKVYHSIAKNFEPDTFEFLYPADGKWYEISAYPSAGGLSVYFKNIDERKIAAEKLQKAFEEKNKILESIGDAFFTVNNDWIVTYWNKEAELVLGRKKELILGRNLWDEYDDGIDSESYHAYHKAIATREAAYFETYYETLDMWLEVSAYPSEDGLSVYFKDITLRKTADIRLQEANERFEKVTEATKDAIWDWDIVNHTFYRSKAVERFFGKNASKSLDENDFWKDKFHPEDLAKIQESIYEAIGNPECNRWELQYRIFNEQGELIYVVDRGLIIRNKEGTAVRMVGAMTDISETLHHINTIKMQNAKLRNIAWTQSHVVRAPISRILGIINLIEEEGENFNEIQFWLQQLKISTTEMDDIIKNIVKETIRIEKE